MIITIIDRDPERRIALAKACHEAKADPQCVVPGSRNSYRVTDMEGAKLDTLKSPLFVLRHFRDQECIPSHGEKSSTVYYGGNGGNDNDAPEGQFERIWRPVSGRAGILTATEIQGLINFFNEEDRNDTNRPAVLIAPTNQNTVHALSILCQGYLAVAAKENLGSDNDDLKQALELMGWKDSLSGQLVEDATLARVTERDWWKTVFGETNVEASLKDELKCELGCSLRGLARWIDQLTKPDVIETKQVAGAFLDLCRHRRGEDAR